MSEPSPRRSAARFILEPDRRRLLIDGVPAALGTRAIDVLCVLFEHRDRVVTKDELLERVWAGLVVEENNVQVQISGLRRLLGADAITTVSGRGYRYTGNMEAASHAATTVALPAADRPGNLGPHEPELIGRGLALAEIVERLEVHPLVSIVGAPGMGKSVLARAAAHRLLDDFDDGAWFIELAELTEPEGVGDAIARALGLACDGPEPIGTRLAAMLESWHVLLVLDNCEHLIGAVVPLVEAIAERAPRLRIIATSLERLDSPVESALRLGALDLPDHGQLADIGRFSAVRLFIERARRVVPAFDVDDTNAAAVADICRRLDGLPLAIELAAARVGLLGAHGVRDRLDDRFKLLVDSSRAKLPRHQTLAAAMSWTYSLLSTPEQTVLRRLGIFVGGWTVDLAQAVVAEPGLDEWTVLDALESLIAKSLIVTESGPIPRYGLLATVRAYALERLSEQGETSALSQRHAHAIRDLFVSTEAARFGDGNSLDKRIFTERLAPEVDNLRLAFAWALHEEPASAQALATASAWLLRTLGSTSEGLDMLQAVRPFVDDAGNPLERARYWFAVADLGGLGRLPLTEVLDAVERASLGFRVAGTRRRLLMSLYIWGWSLLPSEDAKPKLDEMRSVESPTDPPWVRALILNLNAQFLYCSMQFEAAIEAHRLQRVLLMQAPGEEANLAICDDNLSAVLNCLERFDEAVDVARASLARRPDGRLQGRQYILVQLMYAQAMSGKLEEARSTARGAMSIWRRDGTLNFASAYLAVLLAKSGLLVEAALVDGASEAVDRQTPMAPLRRQARAHVAALLAGAGNGDAIARARRTGESLDEAGLEAVLLRVF